VLPVSSSIALCPPYSNPGAAHVLCFLFWSGDEEKEVSSCRMSLKTREGTGICKRMGEKEMRTF